MESEIYEKNPILALYLPYSYLITQLLNEFYELNL